MDLVRRRRQETDEERRKQDTLEQEDCNEYGTEQGQSMILDRFFAVDATIGEHGAYEARAGEHQDGGALVHRTQEERRQDDDGRYQQPGLGE